MGISIHLNVAKSVTREEWEKVYEETLELVRHFPLAEKREIDIHGVKTICLVKSEEHTYEHGWIKTEERLGWFADGDFESLSTAEEYHLSRNLIEDNEVEQFTEDAMYCDCLSCINDELNDEWFEHVYLLWGAKTQGEPYHIFLLAVACLIEARLGIKAFVYGDITRGQCRKAVEFVNEIVDCKIEMPSRCYPDRLLERINNMDFSDSEKITVFEKYYLGTKDAAFGEIIRGYFSKESLDSYWEERFKHYRVYTIGFSKALNDYLLWGFDLDKLCAFVDFEGDDGEMLYEDFIIGIMDSKLYLKEKNCYDPLKIDQEAETPYGIGMLFGQFAFAGAKNKKVDRYISIEEIRVALKKGIGDRLNVDSVIDKYLEKEKEQKAPQYDDADIFGEIIKKQISDMEESYDKYEVSDYSELRYYEAGDRMHPTIAKSLGKSKIFLDSALNESDFAELNNKSVDEKFRWIVENNKYVLIRDTDWYRVYENLEENPDSFARYYPLMRVKVNKTGQMHMTRALMVNDDLYRYSKVLADEVQQAEINGGE